MQPYLGKIQRQRREDANVKRVFESGEATLIHHNPETGVKVIKVTSQAGSRVAGAPSTWCTGKIGCPDMVKRYDPEGTHSFVFHFPKDPDKNERIIGAYGEYREGGSNFQNKQNTTVPESNWNAKIKEHGLDKIKELQGVVRGIDFSAADKSHLSKELTDSIKKGAVKPEDISHAIKHNYLTDEHKSKLVSPNYDTHPSILHSLSYDNSLHQQILVHKNADANVLVKVVKNTSDPEVHRAIIAHKNTDDYVLRYVAHFSIDPEVHKAIEIKRKELESK